VRDEQRASLRPRARRARPSRRRRARRRRDLAEQRPTPRNAATSASTGSRHSRSGGVELADRAAIMHRDPVGGAQRLLLVVGHEHAPMPCRARARAARREPLAQRAVEAAVGLVEQQQPRAGRERAGERDALLLAAAQLVDGSVARWSRPTSASTLRDPLPRSSRVEPLHARAEGDVAGDVAVREQRVVLEHESDARASLDGDVATSSAVDADRAGPERVEPGDAAEQRRLPAAARAEERDDLAGRDVEVDVGEHVRDPSPYPARPLDVEARIRTSRPSRPGRGR
jgi:hypothetical protein